MERHCVGNEVLGMATKRSSVQHDAVLEHAGKPSPVQHGFVGAGK